MATAREHFILFYFILSLSTMSTNCALMSMLILKTIPFHLSHTNCQFVTPLESIRLIAKEITGFCPSYQAQAARGQLLKHPQTFIVIAFSFAHFIAI